MQGDQSHAIIFYALDDATLVFIRDVAMFLMSPPNQHVCVLQRVLAQSLFGVGKRGGPGDDVLAVFEDARDGTADAVGVNAGRLRAFRPDEDAHGRFRFVGHGDGRNEEEATEENESLDREDFFHLSNLVRATTAIVQTTSGSPPTSRRYRPDRCPCKSRL